ncbi:MAG: DUF2160 family membrane protein [Candidatus Caldarchaeum sp.]|nr:DUF2160 family membrane protein [Candidatus Caldarchaeum sp.]
MVGAMLSEIENFLNSLMPWMYWKAELVLFLAGFFSFLTFLAVLSLKRPSNARVGILRIPTTLGDRVFISAVSLIAIMLSFMALGLEWYFILLVGIPIVFLIMWRG